MLWRNSPARARRRPWCGSQRARSPHPRHSPASHPPEALSPWRHPRRRRVLGTRAPIKPATLRLYAMTHRFRRRTWSN